MILCQQCTHENPYNRELCVVCGARLMIITSTPTATAYGGIDSLLRPTLEEHLLERISSLESQLERAQDRLELVLDLVHRQRQRLVRSRYARRAGRAPVRARAVEAKAQTLWRDDRRALRRGNEQGSR